MSRSRTTMKGWVYPFLDLFIYRNQISISIAYADRQQYLRAKIFMNNKASGLTLILLLLSHFRTIGR
jgi:hypothetical protein